jgi:hypothetical protein
MGEAKAKSQELNAVTSDDEEQRKEWRALKLT